MIPDTSGWPEDSLRWVAGLDRGLWQAFPDEAAAQAHAAAVSGIPGWTVAVEPMEDAA